MFILKNFLFCMKLETGGLIIGWIYLIVNVFLFLFSAAYLTFFNCSDFERLIQITENRICLFERDFIVFAVLFVITAIGLVMFSYYNCIMGIKERNFERIKPFVNFLAVVAICSMYGFMFFTWQGAILALIQGIINGYLFFVVYSLFIVFRDRPNYKLTNQLP